MIVSELILPLRFYNNLYEQSRFQKEHSENECRSDLNYPTNQLPSFQITRDNSLNLPTQLYLKKVCSETSPGAWKVVPQGANIFSPLQARSFFGDFPKTRGAIIDNGSDPPFGALVKMVDLKDCGGIGQALDLNFPYIDSWTTDPAEINFPVQNIKYVLKIVVDKFKNQGGTFRIKIYDGTITDTLLLSIEESGIYDLTFTATNGNICIQFFDQDPDNEFLISYLQVTAWNQLDVILSLTDVELNDNAVQVIGLQDGRQIIFYCEEGDYSPEPGEYYYLLKCGDDEIYFSEVFYLRPLSEIQDYFKIEWWNSCDIANILYTGLSCEFHNILYLDSSLFNPKWNTSEKVTANGDEDEIPQFKRWEKSESLDIVCFDFLADALSGIFLHEFIFLTKPLNIDQEVTEEYSVLKAIPDINEVLSESKQRVNLTLVLNDKFVKTGCCTNASRMNAAPQKYTAVNSCGGGDSYELILSGSPDPGDGLFPCGVDEQLEVQPDDLIKNTDTGLFYYLELTGGNWVASRIMPKITSIVDVLSLGLIYRIDAELLKNTWGKIQYNKDGAGWITLATVQADANGDIAYDADTTVFNTGGAPTDLDFRVEMIILGSTYGFSAVVDFI